MAILKRKDFKEILDLAKYRLYFLSGDNILEIQQGENRLIETNSSKGFGKFNITRFDGLKQRFDEFIENLNLAPFMVDRRILSVKNFDFGDISPTRLEVFWDHLKDFSDKTIVIISVLQGKENDKKLKKGINNIGDHGVLFEFNQPIGWELEDEIFDVFKLYEKDISKKDLKYFISVLPKDNLVLKTEAKKISFYKIGKKLSKEDIDTLTPKELNFTAFELARNIIEKNIENSFKIIENLLYKRIDPIAIIGAIHTSFMDLYIAYLGKKQGVSQDKIIEKFLYKGKEFRIRNAYRDIGRFDIKDIKNGIEILAKLDVDLKTASKSNKLLLEIAILNIII